MKKNLIYSLIGLFLLTASTLRAQDTLYSVFRPRLGMGTGVMTYYGEIQNYQKGFSPTVNRFGGVLYVNAPISRMFNLEFSATYAKIASNERGLVRNFNFESRIRMGTAMLYYNFYPLFQENRSQFHPFIGTGISSFEFLSKSDMFDAEGNQYHYWSDGSIMNLAEDDPLASEAVPLTRDYTYETDLRELNADNLGKYREQSLAFPLAMGVEWHMTPRWDFRIAATYNFTFTDLIDNLSPAGTGIREGDQKNDRLLFSYVSLSYDLQLKKKDENGEDLFDEEGIELYADWDPNDFDKDGVIDAFDQCPGTPVEALVDENGCPLDEDNDGVPDYRDDEPDTAPDSYVDEFGVTLTESDLEAHLRRFYDSTGYEHDFEELRTEIVLNKEKAKYYKGLDVPKKGLSYVIVVGKEKKDVTVNDLHKYLGFNDYDAVTKGDTIYYTLGSFDSIEDAVAARQELESRGVDTELGRNTGNQDNIMSVDEKVIEKIEKINIEEGRESPEYEMEKVYRVQLGAFKTKVNTEEVFPGLDVIYGASEEDNLNRYYTGSYDNYESADSLRKALARKGFKSTFVVAYDQQRRVTLVEAGVEENKLPPNYTEEGELETFVEPHQENDGNNGAINEADVKYRIRLAYFGKGVAVETETVNQLYTIGGIKPVKGKDGSTTYYSRDFKTAAERDAAMEEYKSYGLENMEPVIEYRMEFFSKEEFDEKRNN